ncbi:F-box only protein 39-like [Gigantopelta aegis]|uniref:F-box only protein 39-like n=1 Tax=Gigantopelta aegis TaxID=1735272 RepID=UPI001B88B9E9|nr:F-box only protein 39-like [Gigantopelta aegis]
MKENSIWNYLPDTALIKIYLCLQDRWRVNMAVVCKNWNRVFASPCLWRTRYMDLGGYRAITAGEKACSFAQSHGAHLQYLYLTCNHPTFPSCRIIQNTIDTFLKNIQAAKLIHFELERLNMDTFWKFENLKGKVIGSFTRFFHRQRHLKNFNMSDAHFSMPSGCRVLEAVGSASGSTIRSLCIEDFFQSRLAVYQDKRFRNAFFMFNSLSHLYVNYSCLCDEILEGMAANLTGKLRNISCRIYRTDPHFHRISSNAWEKLRSRCPMLSLDLWFEGIGMSSEIIPILVPEAPVREVHMWTGFDESADWRLNETLNHIATHHRKIVLLAMELDNNNESIDHCLVRMLTRCKGMRSLFVNAVISVPIIDEICTLQANGQIDLHTFHVTSCGLSEIDRSDLWYIKEKFLPIMLNRGLNFKISSGYFTDTMF